MDVDAVAAFEAAMRRILDLERENMLLSAVLDAAMRQIAELQVLEDAADAPPE